MNYSKLAQLVQELEQNGFEEEATNLADAMQTEASPDVILSNSNVISEMDEIVGGVLYHLNIDNNRPISRSENIAYVDGAKPHRSANNVLRKWPSAISQL